MAYTPDYTEGDLSASIIDIIVKVVITVGIFAVVIVLLLIYNWMRKKM